ncbi:MAG: kelch repeat-containing protein [Planctomycetota bacterium]
MRFQWLTLCLLGLMFPAVGVGPQRCVAEEVDASPRASKSASLATDAGWQSQFHRPLPEPLTSFGAAVVRDYLYVFSGHSGAAHGFGKDLLVNHFRRIQFDNPDAEWEELSMHDSAQSTALVTDGEYLYRVGGLSFKNSSGSDEPEFDSTDYFTRYDIAADQWTEMPALPARRSSLDAAVVGRTIYVAGGWDLSGESSRNAQWHDTIEAFDLDHPDAGWTSIPGPGYELRAISAASHQGKLYVIGGLGPDGFIRRTSVFDPSTQSWSDGPELRQDASMTGFATSSFAVGGQLFTTGASGIVYRLDDDGEQWDVADRLLYPRMFLRLLPVGDDRLIAVGGTGPRGRGRMAVIESLRVDSSTRATTDSISPKVVRWSVPYSGETKHSQALVLDGMKLYAFGGNKSWSPHDFSESAFSNEAFVFDLGTQGVERLPDMPMPLQSGCAVLNRSNSEHTTVAVLGGMNFGDNGFSAVDTVVTFDPESLSWAESDVRLPNTRSMADATIHEDAIWVFGGSDAGLGSESRDRVLHWWGDDSPVGPLPNVNVPHPRRSAAGAVVDGRYFMIGGLAGGMSIEKNVDVFDFQTRAWSSVPSPPSARVFPRACVIDESIYLFGGFSDDAGYFSECTKLECFDTESGTWSVLAETLPGVDASMRIFDFNDRLLFFGVDREDNSRANFVLVDLDPHAQPDLVDSSTASFGRRKRDEAAENAKSLMRKDDDKDGMVSFEELGERMRSLGKDADANADQLISYEEAVAYFQSQLSSD